MKTGTFVNPRLDEPAAEGVKDALEAIQAACEAHRWTLIAPDGRVWQNKNPMLISAVLLAELGGHMQLSSAIHRTVRQNDLCIRE